MWSNSLFSIKIDNCFFYHIIIFFWIFLSLIFCFFPVFFIWSYSFPFTFVSFEKIILNFELFFNIFMRSNNSSLLSIESQSFSPSSLGCIFCSEPCLDISQHIQLHMWPRYFQDSFILTRCAHNKFSIYVFTYLSNAISVANQVPHVLIQYTRFHCWMLF